MLEVRTLEDSAVLREIALSLHVSVRTRIATRLLVDDPNVDIDGGLGQGDLHVMTENERRAQDVLTREDLLLRGLTTIGLVAVFLFVLLSVTA